MRTCDRCSSCATWPAKRRSEILLLASVSGPGSCEKRGRAGSSTMPPAAVLGVPGLDSALGGGVLLMNPVPTLLLQASRPVEAEGGARGALPMVVMSPVAGNTSEPSRPEHCRRRTGGRASPPPSAILARHVEGFRRERASSRRDTRRRHTRNGQKARERAD